MQKAKKSGIFFRDVSKLFWILVPAMGMFLLVYFMGVLSPIQSQNNQNLQVGGIENKVQYLTSLVLTTPSGNELFLNYDEAGHYLKIGGTINADEISIGLNIGSQGSAILGGEGSSLNNVDNATLVGGNQNTVSNINNPTLLGGQGNEISSDGAIGELVTILGGEGNTINARGGENITIVGGENNTIIPAAGSSADNIVIFGSENQVRSQDTVILGQNVAVEGGVENIFVWSQSDDDFKPKTSNAFYVNTKNGLILNKTTGNASVDLAGAVKTIQYPDNLSNTGNVAEGTLIYVESGSLSAFCGYDGNLWVPLSEDASTHWLCFGSNQDACVGPLPKNIGDASHGGSVVGTLASNGSDVSKFSSDNYIPRRDAELGDWVKIPWTFNTLDRDTCAYGCGIGFHPGDDGLDGLYIGNCQACSPILNMYDWKTAGVGKDNCDFGCKASFAYDGADRTCEDCARGTYTAPNGHQLTSCSDCTKPQTIGIATEGFKDWVSNGVGINQCDYNCKPRFSYAFNGTTGGNTCTRCAVGTYSPGDQTPSCENCNNRQTIINYSVNGVNSSLDPSRYTSNGDAINTCSWECKAELGLEKNATSCVCPSGQHLELGVCTLNTKRVTCGGNIPLNAYAIPPSNLDGRMEIIRQGSWTNGSWPSALNRSYNAGGVSNTSCKWECNAGFEINKNNNTECMAKTITVACGGSMPSSANNVLGTSSYTQIWNGYNYTPSKSWTQVSGTPGECQYRAKIISQCGSADGVASKYKPTVGLCDANATTTPVVSESSTQWSWTCRSSDNVTRSCAAPRLALEGGACNPSINGTTQTSLSSSPSLCAQGSVIGFTENPSASIYTNKWTWSCQGDTGTTKVDCVAHKRNDNKRLCTTTPNTCSKIGDPTSPKIGTSIIPFANGTQWKCEEDVYCTVCNPGYTGTVYDTQAPANCVAINASRDEDCPDVGKKSGVAYKLGANKYQQNSIAGGPWTPVINGWSYTNNSNPGSCQYTCAVDYLWDGDDCIPADQTRPASCPATAKPSGAGYILGATGFTQSSVDGGVNWSPSIPSSWQYVSSNPSYCEYTCATNYEWKIATQKCEPKTKIFDCISPTGELSGSWIRNTVNKYTQTWNGSAWLPAGKTSTYNITPSLTDCRYKCKDGYEWNGSSCVADTKIVTFNGNGGSGHSPTTKTIQSGQPVGTLPTSPTRAGYTFNGWYTAASGGSQVTTSRVITSNVTYYAQWTVESCPAPVLLSYSEGMVTFSVSTGNTLAFRASSNGSTRGSYGSHGGTSSPRNISSMALSGSWRLQAKLYCSGGLEAESNILTISSSGSGGGGTPPTQPYKVDWNGRPLEWDRDGIYRDLWGDGRSIVKVGIKKGIRQPSDSGCAGSWSAGYDGGLDPDRGECLVSDFSIPPEAYAKVYIVCSQNQWCSATIKDSSGLITKNELYIGSIWK